MANEFDRIAAQLAEARAIIGDALEQLRHIRPDSATIPPIVEAIEAIADARAMLYHDR